MAFSQWWTFTEGVVAYDHDDGAVYEFVDDTETVVYIGSTNALKRRLNEHLAEDAKSCIKINAKKFRFEYRSDYAAEELKLYDAFAAQFGTPPKCNVARPPG